MSDRQEKQSPPLCATCARPLEKALVSRVFPDHHARCIERALARARAES